MARPRVLCQMKQSLVEVNLGVLADNIRSMRKALKPSAEIMFVVKANAYGHGAGPVARRAAECGVKWFAVAYVKEALRLRNVVHSGQVLVLGVAGPEDVPALLEKNIIPIVVSERHARLLGDAAKRLGKELPVHLKIDTGMGRLGFAWETAADTILAIAADSGLDIRGICTHFAAVKPTNLASAKTQLDRFNSVAQAVENRLSRKLFKHVSSSRAFLYVNEWDFDAVRPGIALYGYGARSTHVRIKTQPILQWKSYVVQVKQMPANASIGYYGSYVTVAATNIATLCVGYTDGYNRLLSNKGCVLIRGRRRPVVGRVSMNWVTVDVGPDTDVCEGDEAVLIGTQGSESIWADEIATLCGTIPYEILTDVNAGLERVYVD
jgi:alanine racemase